MWWQNETEFLLLLIEPFLLLWCEYQVTAELQEGVLKHQSDLQLKGQLFLTLSAKTYLTRTMFSEQAVGEFLGLALG